MTAASFTLPPGYRELFLSEAGEHLNAMARQLLVLEETPQNLEELNALFRAVHSLKGMSATMGYDRMATLAHRLEDVLARFRREGRLPAAAIEQLRAGHALLEKMLEEIAVGRPESSGEALDCRPAAEPATPAGRSLVPGGGQYELKVVPAESGSVALSHWLWLVNELMRLGTLLSCRPAPEELAEDRLPASLEARWRCPLAIEEATARLVNVAGPLHVELALTSPPAVTLRPGKAQEGNRVRVSAALLDRLVNLTGELVTVRHGLRMALGKGSLEALTEELEQFDGLLDQLRQEVLDARMVALSTVTERLPHLVQALARASGKHIALRLSGTEERLDRAILEAVVVPLEHAVRNAIDHGIESSGTIQVRALRQSGQLLLEVADDGRGMDGEAIRRRAVADGFLTAPDAARLSPEEALMLVCRPGFSTASRVTASSGRGVGMDAVRQSVEQLGGHLELESRPGAGTCVRMVLPRTVAIAPVLLVSCGGEPVGFPVTRILSTLEPDPGQLRWGEDGWVACLAEEELPLIGLHVLLGRPADWPLRPAVVVVNRHGRRLGLVVEALLGQQDVFIKPLRYPLDQLPGLCGATQLGDGRIAFLLEPQALLDAGSATVGLPTKEP